MTKYERIPNKKTSLEGRGGEERGKAYRQSSFNVALYAVSL
jgi:hypothetical protein